MFIGQQSSPAYELDPGDTFDYGFSDQLGQVGGGRLQLRVSDFYGTGTVGDKLCWIASP